MLWNYPKKSIVDKRVTIKYSMISQNLARENIFNQLGSPVFIEGSRSQKGGFQQFLGNYYYIICISYLMLLKLLLHFYHKFICLYS